VHVPGGSTPFAEAHVTTTPPAPKRERSLDDLTLKELLC
jgi:hypothetical protein